MVGSISQPSGATKLDEVGTGDVQSAGAPVDPTVVDGSSEDAGAVFVVGDPGLGASADSVELTGALGVEANPLARPGSSGVTATPPGAQSAVTDASGAAGSNSAGPLATLLTDTSGTSDPGSSAGSGGATTDTVSVAGSGLVFNNTFEPGVTFESNIVSAEQALAGLWTNSVTLNLDFQAVNAGINGLMAFNSWPSFVDVTYAQLKAALTSHATTSYALAAVAALPVADPNPAGGNDWALPEAYARMLGLSSSTATFDDTVTLNTSYSWSYRQDVVNAMEHEISEGGMGRVGGLGDQNNVWSTMDLFRYTSTGAPDYTDGRDGVTTFFSYNGGTTLSTLSFNNEYNSSDVQVNTDDTADFTQQDVFGISNPGETNTLSLTDEEIIDVLGWNACFCRGTLILTERGEVAVEDLAIGDRVVTVCGAARPIKWLGQRAYDRRFVAGNHAVLPIRIEAGALADGVPARDLFVSREHALYIDGMLVPAWLIVNGATVRQAESVERLEYFHIEFAAHDVILAEGAPAESYVDCDNRGMFHNAGEFARLYPGAAPAPRQFCAPRLEESSGELTEIRAELWSRAEALGHALTDDPDLDLIVDGVIVRGEAIAKELYRFMVPAGSRAVWLASRSAVPHEVEPGSPDRRRLGVLIRRIVLCEDDLRIEIGHGHPSLRDGFHDDEGEQRWTDGLARLPEELLRPFIGDVEVEVHLISPGLRYPLAPSATPQASRARR